MRNLFLFGLILLMSVGANAQFISNLNIKGSIKNADGPYVYLMELGGDQMIPIDSAKISDNNSFFISTNISKPNFFQLSNGGQQYTILILEPGETVNIDIDAQNMLQPSKISGSAASVQVYDMLQKINSYDAAQKQLEEQYKKIVGTADQDSVGQILANKFELINQQRINYIKTEINNSPSLASLLFIDKISIDEEFELYRKLDKELNSKYPKNAFVIELHKKVDGKMKLAPGSIAPEINLASPSGEYIKLSSLRGKVVLIDFWASWCSPCRRENPNNVKMYNKYKAKGFEIYAVSLDKERSKWVQAIDADGLTWVHVSDLRYWQSVAAKEYGVGSIPFTVLIDKEGKVIEVGLRGVALEQKLEELLGE